MSKRKAGWQSGQDKYSRTGQQSIIEGNDHGNPDVVEYGREDVKHRARARPRPRLIQAVYR